MVTDSSLSRLMAIGCQSGYACHMQCLMTALKVFKYTSYLQPGLHLIHFASIKKAKKVYIQSPIEASSVNCTTYNDPTYCPFGKEQGLY